MDLAGFHIDRVRNLFYSTGVKSITMDDVSKELGISKKTLYQKVLNKDKLIELVFMDSFYRFRIETDEIQRNQTDPITTLYNLYNYILSCIRKNKEVVSFSLKKYYPEFTTILKQLYKKQLKFLLMEIIEKGLRLGVLNPGFSRYFIRRYLEENVFGFMKNPLNEIDDQISEMRLEYFYLQMLGICTINGKQVLNKCFS